MNSGVAPHEYNIEPLSIIDTGEAKVYCFSSNGQKGNIDQKVVTSFGEEWKKFHNFDDSEIDRLGKMYFDIIPESVINQNTYGIDIGCGTGRWTKYLSNKIGFMEAIDPSDAILSATKLLKNTPNVRLSKASIENIPFDDKTFDFGMSVGVLHHIPDTQQALTDCVKKIKIGGYFYVYLYYDLENKGLLFRGLLSVATAIRKIVSSMPSFLKKITCDIIAVLFYMPFVLFGRSLKAIGLKGLAKQLPLSPYQGQSFYIIRNDSLDRFGTSLEQRFSRKQIKTMMENAGLSDIIIADTVPYWHALGTRVK